MVAPTVAWRGARPSGVASASWLRVVGAAWTRPYAGGQQLSQHRWRAFGTHGHASVWTASPPRPNRLCPDCGAAFPWHGRRLYSSRPPGVPPGVPPGMPSSEEKRLSELLGDKKQELEAMEKPIILGPPPGMDTNPAANEPSADTSKPSTSPGESLGADMPSGNSPDAPDTPGPDLVEEINAADAANTRLPSSAEQRRTEMNARFSGFMDELQARVFVASQRLNDLTGYSAIEQIKARNAELEAELAAAQAELTVARREYQAVNERRVGTQRQVTTLLARKDTWAPADLERFTELYRSDHELEAAAARATVRLNEAEAAESHLSAAVTAGILKRYHEEQVWSDRIRRQSTWGTWGLMAVNVVLFIVLQFFAEPWRRHRLMRGIAEAESGLMNDVRTELADVRAVLARMPAPAAEPVAAAVPTADSSETAESADSEPAAEPESAAAPEPTPAPAPAVPGPAPTTSPLFAIPFPIPFSIPAWTHSWEDAKLTAELAVDPDRWRAWIADARSERQVSLHMRDVSWIAVQSAAAGASLAGSIVLLIWHWS